MAEITKSQKILAGVLVASLAYLLFDYSTADEKPATTQNRRPTPAAQQKKPSRAAANTPKQNDESTIRIAPITKQTIEKMRNPEYALVWGADPFAKGYLISDEFEAQESSSDDEIVQLDDYTLSAISHRGDEAVVLINQEVLKPGDVIDGLRLEKILPNSAILTKDGRKYIIKLKGV